MGISEELTQRIRALVAADPRVAEKRMFGGICFLLDGRILVSARRTGSLMVQCGAAASPAATQEPGVTMIEMRGKPMNGFVDVAADHLETDDELERWIDLAERYVSSLPPKG